MPQKRPWARRTPLDPGPGSRLNALLVPQQNFGLGTREPYLAERGPAPGTDRTLAQLEEQSTQKVNPASVPRHSAQGHSVERERITLLNTPESNWRCPRPRQHTEIKPLGVVVLREHVETWKHANNDG